MPYTAEAGKTSGRTTFAGSARSGGTALHYISPSAEPVIE